MNAGTFVVGVARDLGAAVSAWCDQQRVKVLRDGGQTTTAVLPSLLDQLQAAVGSGSSRHARRSTGGRCPANLDAIDLLGRLRVLLATWTARLAAGVHGPRLPDGQLWAPGPLADRVRRLPGLPWDDDQAAALARVLLRLADAATTLLVPPDLPVWRLVRDTACPRCWYRTVIDTDDDGQPIRVPPLLVEFDGAGRVGAVTCAVCWAGWWRHEVPGLWDELQAAHALMAACGLDDSRQLRSWSAGRGGTWPVAGHADGLAS